MLRINQGWGVKAPPYIDKVKNGKFHLYIGTPSRDETCYIGYAASLAKTMTALVSAGVEVSMDTIRNSCFVATARNMLLCKFLESSATHILMIDDDMSWDYLAPLEMLAYGKDFISAAAPVKHENRFACSIINKLDDGLVEFKEVGGAFIMLSREMVIKMRDHYRDELGHPMYDGFPRLFSDVYTPSQWISEDYAFCDRWRRIGGKIYGMPNVNFEHLGKSLQVGKLSETFGLNSSDYLEQLMGIRYDKIGIDI